MKIEVSTDPNDPEYVSRVLWQFQELARQEPYLAMKMVEFLQAGVTQAMRDYRVQMTQTRQQLQGQALGGKPLALDQIGVAFDKGTPPWQIIV